ncbi:surface lipoprotein assembly modifier [Stenotrophomonas sp. Sm0581]|nr:surface lipoprotein assembly modifier [Stenotrophomonas maltophilia]MDQ7302369.1 surface lipoprotein assembly modifier [Stenotrophomonas sp. Sm0581]
MATTLPRPACVRASTAIWRRCRHGNAGRERSRPGPPGATTSTAARPVAPACSAWATPASSNGNCPTPSARGGLDYDASLERRWVLRGHHGLYVRGLAFGQAWRGHSAYNELNANVQAGYSWRSARQTVMLAPSYDYQGLGNHALQGGSGVHAEWQYTLDARSLLKLEADWKRQRYRQHGLASNYDGELAAVYATWFRALNPRWSVFAGLDVTDSNAADPANGYCQRGLRLGVARQWSGTTATVFASLRERDYDAWSPLLEARRQDSEQNLIAIVRSERLAVAGLVPSLSLRYARIDSNVGWLYSHDRSLLSLKWERAF